jgi:dihydroorotate dehydrogenase electron transfer subunit
MKKFIGDLVVSENIPLRNNHFLLKLTQSVPLPLMMPGQFVQVKIDDTPSVFLRRTFSVNYIDRSKNEMWLLIQIVGDGTNSLSKYKTGDTLNLIFPLGNSFSMPTTTQSSLLLVGGGVGVAPLLFLGATLVENGFKPTFLIGARNVDALIELQEFQQFGEVFVTTEDGSAGEKGFVTDHFILKNSFDKIYTCGPTPMMQAIARFAENKSIECEVSLENKMACGFGVCLCCVTQTHEGNQCVCTNGPVFNIKDLVWQS